uniref:Uncharacterized protein n=1 Tax=Timema monikensis TaxID=170555 RepID=A0A7R9E4J4_9NEOP|nr:unnamed protein product [Timema monikensis]
MNGSGRVPRPVPVKWNEGGVRSSGERRNLTSVPRLTMRNVACVGALLAWVIIVGVATTPTPPEGEKERISALMKGDFIIGALFSLHHQPKQRRAGNTLSCGEIREIGWR